MLVAGFMSICLDLMIVPVQQKDVIAVKGRTPTLQIDYWVFNQGVDLSLKICSNDYAQLSS